MKPNSKNKNETTTMRLCSLFSFFPYTARIQLYCIQVDKYIYMKIALKAYCNRIFDKDVNYVA